MTYLLHDKEAPGQALWIHNRKPNEAESAKNDDFFEAVFSESKTYTLWNDALGEDMSVK